MTYDAAVKEKQWGNEILTQRLAIANKATTLNADALTLLVLKLAEYEGRYQVARQARKAQANGGTALTAATGIVENGADDEWSGRKNDVRRAKFDGVLAEFTDIARSERF
jgi:hypothetical protein